MRRHPKGVNRQTLPQRVRAYLRQPLSLLLLLLVAAAAVVTVGALFFILVHILVKGIPYLTPELFALEYNSENVSMFPAIITTLEMTALSLLIAAPLGIFSAVYLVEYARRGNKMVNVIRMTAETLSGIPSILFGLFGYTVFCTLFRLQTSILAGALTMSLCVLPTIIRTTEESLLAVPQSYQEGALALGAGKFRIIMGMVLPCAMPGVLTAIILAMGRIVGESAALLFTAGVSYHMPTGPFSHIMESGRTLTLHLYQTAREASSEDAMNVAFATAAVLLILVFLLNRLAALLSRMLKKG